MEELVKKVQEAVAALPKKRGRPRKNPLPGEVVSLAAPVSAPALETTNEDIRKLASFLDYWKKEIPDLSTEKLLRIYAHITV